MKKLIALTSAEMQVFRQFEHRVWSDMQRVFPRLKDFDGPSRRKNDVNERTKRTKEEVAAGKKPLDKFTPS